MSGDTRNAGTWVLLTIGAMVLAAVAYLWWLPFADRATITTTATTGWNGPEILVVEVEGHRYVVFTRSASYGLAALHAESCPCRGGK